jgi:hypothetical protein
MPTHLLALVPSLVLILAGLPRAEAQAGPLAGPEARATLGTAGSPESPSVALSHPADVLLLRMALARAASKLAKPACLLLLDDFQDGEGRPLSENLATTGMEPADYLARLAYRDGAGHKSGLCQSRGAAALTRPNDRMVYICGANFRAQIPGIRANTLIHEMLHTLGLSENPPSSAAINVQVRKRCGS